ncbi:MAG: hypothetical protein QOJ89_1277 [bacterium]|jgi:hypothetical protein
MRTATQGLPIGTLGWPGARVAGAQDEGMTHSPHSTTVAALAVLAASAIAATPAAASIPVESLVAATPAAAYDGTAMWSRLDPVTGRYLLVRSVDGGAPTQVAVPERDGAFDVDLGSNRSGNTYAVYTRNGDIYRLNPRTAVETRLVKLSSPDRVERDPTIQRGRIAFLRRVGGMDELRIGDTTTGAKGTRLLLERKHIQGVELGIGQVAWVDSVKTRAPSSRQRVHVRNIASGRDHVVYVAGSGGASFSVVTKPSFTADLSSFIWARSRIGTAGSRIVRYALRTGKLSYAQGTPRYASVAWINDELGAVVSSSMIAGLGSEDACVDANTQYCSIQYTGPLTFNLKP